SSPKCTRFNALSPALNVPLSSRSYCGNGGREVVGTVVVKRASRKVARQPPGKGLAGQSAGSTACPRRALFWEYRVCCRIQPTRDDPSVPRLSPTYFERYSRHASRRSRPLNRIVRSSSTSAPVRSSESSGSEFRVVYSTWRVTGPLTVYGLIVPI